MAEQILYGNFVLLFIDSSLQFDLHYELAEVQKRNF